MNCRKKTGQLNFDLSKEGASILFCLKQFINSFAFLFINSSKRFASNLKVKNHWWYFFLLLIVQTQSITKTSAQSAVVSKVYTDFGGFWYSGGNFSQLPNNSHNVLAFVYNGVTYSTGVNDALLNTKGITFTASSWYALPAILTGAPGNVISVGAMLDESYYTQVYSHPNVKDLTSENVLMDGIHGLNIGTGYTNLPAATKAEFNIQTILTDKINDAIPDILVAQIAGPGGTADVFKFVDASGNTVGNTVNVIFNNAATAPLLSMYGQDQYLVQNTPTLTASTSKPYNNSNWNSNNAAGTGNGQMRMVAFKLSEFGITASNYTQIKKFVTLPSGSTDLAFVAYSNGSMNVPPSLGVNETTTSSVICSAANSTSNAFLSVRPYSSSGGSLSYYWELSSDGGTNWSTITNNATYSGATTVNLSIIGATAGYKYRCTVTESGTGYSSQSSEFTITSAAGAALGGTLNPTSFTNCIYGGTSGTTALSVAPTGGTGSYSYTWSYSSSLSGTYVDIPNAIASTYSPDLSVAGTSYYKVTVKSGCYTNISTAATVTVNGGTITSTTNGAKCASTGTVTLSATASAGTVNWYAASSGGTALGTGNTYSPSPASTTTYFAAAVSGGCESVRVPVVASVFTSTLALTTTATNACLGSSSTVSIYGSTIADGTYTLNYTFSGSNSVSNGSASVTFVNGNGSFLTNALTVAGSTTITLSGVVTSSGCTVSAFSGNTASITIASSSPSVSNFNITATSACTNNASTVTISSSSLTSGTYIVTYNISGTNTLASTTAQMSFTSGSPGTGTFTLPLLTAAGTNNVITVTGIALLSTPGCGSTVNKSYTFANNSTPILNAGNSFSVCATAGTPILISGSSSASDYSALAWSTSNGTGTFTNNTTALALTNTSYSPTAADITAGSVYLTLTATANSGCSNVIKTITLSLPPDAVGGTVSTSQSITYNTAPATLTLSGYTGTIANWEKSTDPGFTSPINLSFTTATLTGANIGNITSTTYFRAKITRGTCVAYSNYVTISISGSPTITSFTPATASAGTTVTITGTNFTGSTAVSFGGVAASSFSVVNSTTITAVVGSGASGSVFVTNTNGTGSLTGFVFCTTVTPSITIVADANNICSGSTVRFNANITNGGASPTYQWKKNGVNVGISSSLYTDAGLVNGDVISCELTSNAICVTSSTVSSNSITIGVTTVSSAVSSGANCINNALNSITHATTGATGIGTPTGLPSGVTAAWNANVITISGTPTVTGTFNYVIPLTGGCGNVSATGTITITTANTVSAASATPVLCINTALTSITHATTGATGIGTATGLPSGVTALWNANVITISGTPTSSGTFNYVIPLTGGCGNVNATGTITVRAANTAGTASTTPTLCVNTALMSITHATTGATGIGTATGLPSGVTAVWNANVITISGTPTSSGTFNYVIPLTGGCGNVSATGTIVVSAPYTSAVLSGSTSICKGSSANLQVSIAGGVSPYTIVYSNGNNNITVSDYVSGSNIPVSPATTTTYSLVSVTSATGCSGTGNSGTAVVTVYVSFTGAVSNSWSNAGNWCNGVVPSASDNIVVNSATALLDTDFTVAGNLTLSGSGSLIIKSGKTLTVGGASDFGNRPVVLQSDATGTAAIGTVSGTLTNAGNVTVERYIPQTVGSTNSGRRWRLLTTPIQNTTINSAWQNGGKWNGTDVLSDTTGTFITGATQGNAVTANANGFDFWSAISNSASSIRTYTQGSTQGSWTALSNTTTAGAFDNQEAYLLFIRGNRNSLYTAGTESSRTTLRATGTLKQGTKTVTISGTKGYTLLGNPYAAPLDFDHLYNNTGNSSVIKQQFWVWDAATGDYGGYKLIKNIGGTYLDIPTPFTGTTGTSTNLTIIQSGQGFFVEPVSAAGGTLTIRENDKAANGAAPVNVLFRAGSMEKMRINLYQQNSNTTALADGVMAVYDNSYTATVKDNDDVRKPNNFNENMAIVRNGTYMIMEARPLINDKDTLYLEMWNLKQQQYQLQLKAEKMEASGLRAYLEDTYLQTKTPVSLQGDIVPVNFTVTSDAASAALTRFRLLFTLDVTPVTDITTMQPVISIYPNPLYSRIAILRIQRMKAGRYTVQIENSIGQQQLQQQFLHAGGSNNLQIQLPAGVIPGLYFIKYRCDGILIKTEKLIID